MRLVKTFAFVTLAAFVAVACGKGPAQAVVAAAAAKKTEMMEAWKAMESSMPGMVADIQKKVMELATAKKLPAGLDKAGLESAKASLEGATAAWAEAGTAFGAGDVMSAVTKGMQVKKTADELMSHLGMSPAPAAAAAPAAEPAKK